MIDIQAPREHNGRMVRVFCDDINCSGKLVYDPVESARLVQHVWRCDGLTHEGNRGELRACERTVFGPVLK